MNSMERQLVCGNEAQATAVQHRRPCADCPFARRAYPGWLGRLSVDEWLRAAHGESLIDCHTTTNWQCAGAAIYRANVAKNCYLPGVLKLGPDPRRVFAAPTEFIKHHSRTKQRVL